MTAETHDTERPWYLSPTEVAAEWRTSTNHVHRAIARGDLPAWRDGRIVRIARADVDAYVAARRVGPPRAEGGALPRCAGHATCQAAQLQTASSRADRPWLSGHRGGSTASSFSAVSVAPTRRCARRR